MSDNPFISNERLIVPYHVRPGEPGVRYIRLGIEDKRYFEEVFARSGSAVIWTKDKWSSSISFTDADLVFLKQNRIKL